MTIDELAADLDRVASQPPGFDQALNECIPILRAGIQENFINQQAPSGGAWPARKDPKPTHPLLVLSGALEAAATGRGAGAVARVVGGDTAEVGVDKGVDLGGIPGAAVHNFGYPPKNIAQREWCGVSEAILDQCEAICTQAVLEHLGAG